MKLRLTSSASHHNLSHRPTRIRKLTLPSLDRSLHSSRVPSPLRLNLLLKTQRRFRPTGAHPSNCHRKCQAPGVRDKPLSRRDPQHRLRKPFQNLWRNLLEHGRAASRRRRKNAQHLIGWSKPAAIQALRAPQTVKSNCRLPILPPLKVKTPRQHTWLLMNTIQSSPLKMDLHWSLLSVLSNLLQLPQTRWRPTMIP